MQTLVSIADLPLITGSRGVVPGRFLFEGSSFGLDHLTLVLGETAPGQGVALHRHTYEELFVVHGGRGTYTVGDATFEAGPGDVVLIPSSVPHRYVNNAQETLYHTAVHATGTFKEEVLE
ncbi:MAG TPA: cupin domain-containing protein [Thermomicrobiales bacterium]|jgi:mannose-6-phosphate isomerase-like protein (cupin superfamily)|nr:cupin domain-containing protein [Thermomicrobiales bacterium]